MELAARYVAVTVLAAAAWLGPGAQPSEAQAPIRVDGIYPRQLPRGETTAVSLAIPTVDAIESADISPSSGVTVSSLTRDENFQGNNTWWTLAIDVGQDAAPGARTLNLHLPAGRTVSTDVVIPSHTPRIADLRLVNVQSNPPAFDLELSATDASGGLGAAPHVWFMIRCDETPLPGVLRGTVERGVVRARIPRRFPGHTPEPGVTTCDVQVRVTDAGGMDSNTLRTTIDVTN